MIYNSLIPPRPYKAINLFGVIFVRKGAVMMVADCNHEHIHTAQMRELLYVGFYILYVAFFLVLLLAEKGKWHAAYRANPFEMEAYDYQGDIRYLEHRKKFSWKKYV